MNPTATLSLDRPIQGPSYDKNRPETRQPWLDFRRPGITATMIRDWGNGSRRRKIIEEKVTGSFEDLSHVPAVNHGNIREPAIQAWVEAQGWGITACDNVFAHPWNPRHLASPDGVTLDPYSGQLETGEEARLLEVKTSRHDLNPGTLDSTRMLVAIQPGSEFDKSNYYTQMNWQMYVMNAAMTLFVWEQRADEVDPETGQFPPLGPPQWCWVPRDQALIDILVSEVAPRALEEIDAAVLAHSLGELPPVSDLPVEDAVLVSQYLTALDNEKIAAAAKAQAWTALQERYASQDSPDTSIDAGFARVTVTTVRSVKRVVDEDGMRAQARTTVERYEKLRERFTTQEPVEGKKLTITRPKN
jgi:hypothetical protein